MLHEKFSSRLQSMCNTFGFENVQIPEPGNFSILDSFSNTPENCSARDAVIVLSCKVHYNPNWGGFGGHPQLLTPMMAGKDESSPAGFLAPFLQLYNFAKERIYLSKTRQGRHLITLSKCFLENDEQNQQTRLTIALDKVAEPDENGAITPVSVSGSRITYDLSTNLRQVLDAQNYEWNPGRNIPIGRYLGSEMFFFTGDEQAINQNNPFYSTLFPYLRQIVTHRTPHLRAAEIHLQQEFNRTIALLSNESHAAFPKLLFLVGLDIDMAPSAGHGKKYFVPWKAYLKRADGNSAEEYSLDQDDLFIQLKQ